MSATRVARSLIISGALGAAAVLAGAPPAAADETTFCNAYITSLPYTIKTQGHYCFNRNLSTNITWGPAVSIEADYVVLDMNGFKLGGGAAGPATGAYGVAAADRRNVTIRGGHVRGFSIGIVAYGGLSEAVNVTIEDNHLDANTFAGIVAMGRNIVIRRNVVSATGGTPGAAGGCMLSAVGISTMDGLCRPSASAEITDNIVTDVDGQTFGHALGIWAAASEGAVVARNTVRLVRGGSEGAAGIEGRQLWWGGEPVPPAVCKDNVVLATAEPYMGCAAPAGPNYP